jgi:hypothetical protein
MFVEVGGSQLAGDRPDAAGGMECAEAFPATLAVLSRTANRKRVS